MNLEMLAHIGLLCMEKILKNTYFDSFGIEHVPKVMEKWTGHKNIKTNIFRIQANDSIVCGYFCIGFIDFMIAGN